MSLFGDKTIKELDPLVEFLSSEEFVIENDYDTYRVSLALLLSLFYDPATGKIYPPKIPGIPIEDLGVKITDFNISLGTSRMLRVDLNAAEVEISFIGLLETEGTVNTITITAQQDTTLHWDEGIKWSDGLPLDTILAGDEYIVHVSARGGSTGDIAANYIQVRPVPLD